MTKDEQIQEMAGIIRIGLMHSAYSKIIAKALYDDKGYRKASEVAREVIRKVEQIVEVKVISIEEDLFHNTALIGDVAKKNGFEEILVELAELKEKYMEVEQ